MPPQDEYLGWTHKLWERCSEETARSRRHDNKDDPTLAFLDVERAVTFCFRREFRFHDECMYQLRRFGAFERWTHELWACCRFEETARANDEPAPWERLSDNDNPILACIDVEGDVTFYFREKVRVHATRIYQFLPLKPG